MMRAVQTKTRPKAPISHCRANVFGNRRASDFWKCESGSVAIQDLFWVPAFALVLAFAIDLTLSLHGNMQVHNWASEGAKAVSGGYSTVQEPGRTENTVTGVETAWVVRDDIRIR